MSPAPAGPLRVAVVGRGEVGEAAALLAREMLDNPLHIAVLGADEERRRRALQTLFSVALSDAPERPLAAYRDGRMIAALAIQPPGACPPSAARQMRMGSRLMLRLGPATLARVSGWLSDWQRFDLRERHWHLGPMAVVAEQRRRGVGARLLEAACERIEAEGSPAVLQTDRENSVRLFERYGFAAEDEMAVLGVRTWLMVRRHT